MNPPNRLPQTLVVGFGVALVSGVGALVDPNLGAALDRNEELNRHETPIWICCYCGVCDECKSRH